MCGGGSWLLHSALMTREQLCIVGLGYVGLPLAHAFARKGHSVAGFDIAVDRIEELRSGFDRTRELTAEQLAAAKLTYSTDPNVIASADIVIVTVPTPVDDKNMPDLTPVEQASITVGKHLKKGAIVVFESTVYPGVTEELCGPILERESGLSSGSDFTLGYSPERINPGDKEHTVAKIKKIVAGQDAATLDRLCELYGSIIEAGIHRAQSIKVAEMAKAIENAQRDLNIAFVNEVALLCHKIGIGTKDVLAAAGTKWNFLRFSPGLVGGHCIGVDPYYLVEKARQLGMETQVITAGRALNDAMAGHVADQVVAALGDRKNPSVLVLGMTFKENVPDTRNSKSADVIRALQEHGCKVSAHDPYHREGTEYPHAAAPGNPKTGPYDAIVLLVPHREYTDDGVGAFLLSLKKGGLVYDLKSVLQREEIRKLGYGYASL